MAHSNLTQWIEDAEAREIRRDAAFLVRVQQKQYLHLGEIVAKVAGWWHLTEDVLTTLHHRHGTQH